MAPGHAHRVALSIERHVDAAQLGKVLRQGAEPRHLQVPSPILAPLDVADADLQHVAGLRAGDGDRSRQEMRARAALALGKDLVVLGEHRKAGRLIRKIGRLARQGVDRHGVAGRDGEHRRQRAVPIPPAHRAGRRRQMMRRHVMPSPNSALSASVNPSPRRASARARCGAGETRRREGPAAARRCRPPPSRPSARPAS